MEGSEGLIAFLLRKKKNAFFIALLFGFSLRFLLPLYWCCCCHRAVNFVCHCDRFSRRCCCCCSEDEDSDEERNRSAEDKETEIMEDLAVAQAMEPQNDVSLFFLLCEHTGSTELFYEGEEDSLLLLLCVVVVTMVVGGCYFCVFSFFLGSTSRYDTSRREIISFRIHGKGSARGRKLPGHEVRTISFAGGGKLLKYEFACVCVCVVIFNAPDSLSKKEKTRLAWP